MKSLTSFGLFSALAAVAAFCPSPATTLSFCGPVIKGNFNGLNRQYPNSTARGMPSLWSFSGPVYVSNNSGASVNSGVILDSQGNIWRSTARGRHGFQWLRRLGNP